MSENEEENPDKIWVSSILSSRTGKGMVQIMWGGKAGQLSVKEARDHALLILQCCEAARSDELVFHFI